MSDELKKRFKDYMDGNLSDDEKIMIEQEIDKLEVYQEVLDEYVGEDKNKKNRGEKKVIVNSKRRAKLENIKMILLLLAFLVAIAVAADIATEFYYNSQEPTRLESYRKVIETAVTTTHPNINVGGSSSSSGRLFTSNIDVRLKKIIGSEYVEVGALEIKFTFSKAEVQWSEFLDRNFEEDLFLHPNRSGDEEVLSDEFILEKLSEGTVAEAFISFDKLYDVNEVLSNMEHKNLDPIWFAVDVGWEQDDFTNNLIGFPYQTLWNEAYWTLDRIAEEGTDNKGLLDNQFVIESRSSPIIVSYGDGELRSENFIKNLKYLQTYENIADEVSFSGHLRLTDKIEYIDKKGVKIYGLVITGPSKEILKLRDEAWVTNIKVGEVEFWNWK